MRFNLISKDADGVGFAARLQDEGNDVRVFIDEANASEVGDGLVDKVGNIHEMIEDAGDEDVFIFDTSGDGMTADYIRSQGFPVLGASYIADRLERERQFGLDVMTDSGILVPKSTNFTSFEDGIEYVKKNGDERLVYKPSNLLGDKSASHVSYNRDDMIQLLQNVKAEVSMENPEFVLQEFHEGIALSTEIWFDGTAALPLMNHTLERKELMNDNLGPSGGCTGNIVWACGDCPICTEVKKLEPFLKQVQYHGPIDLNAIVAEDGVYGLEFTPRFGYDATPTFIWELIDGECGQFFSDVARRQFGSNSPRMRTDGFASSLRLTIPPWPTEKYLAQSGIPIFGIDRADLDHTFLFNLKAGEVTDLCTAGAWGVLLLLTGFAETPEKSFAKPYKRAKNLKVSNKQYRTDLVDQFAKDLETLMSLGV